MWLAALVLCSLSAAPAELRLELLAGRVRAADARGVRTLGEAPTVWEAGQGGFVEVAPLARMRLRWLAKASLELEGGSEVAWRPQTPGQRALCLEVGRLGSARMEVRDGPLRVSLPSGWRILCSGGVVALRGLPDGALEVQHLGGAPVLLSQPSEPHTVRPPWTLLPGAQARIPSAAAAPRALHGKLLPPCSDGRGAVQEAGLEEAPWGSFSWPWSESESQRSSGWGPRWRSKAR
jgi:hypothetical protein